MSALQWKPGDVAALTLARGVDGRDNPDGEAVGIRDNVGSWACGAAMHRMVEDEGVVSVRPLVVIDPEDAAQVERLVRALNPEWGFAVNDRVTDDVREDFADALRSLIAPPKPDEPQGLGAVATDSFGDHWVYTGLRDDDDARWWYHGLTRLKWDRVDAVEVLSDGVQP